MYSFARIAMFRSCHCNIYMKLRAHFPENTWSNLSAIGEANIIMVLAFRRKMYCDRVSPPEHLQ